MLTSLILPIVLSSVALFFASFLSWMVLGLHQHDWRKLSNEAEFMDAVRPLNIAPGNYMFPGCGAGTESRSEDFHQRYEKGPRGVMTIFAQVSMGRNLGLTFACFLAVCFMLAYLGMLALPRGAEFMPVFRFISTAAWMTFLAGVVQHAIWFRCRIVGHVIESIAYAAIVGAIFAALWPGA